MCIIKIRPPRKGERKYSLHEHRGFLEYVLIFYANLMKGFRIGDIKMFVLYLEVNRATGKLVWMFTPMIPLMRQAPPYVWLSSWCHDMPEGLYRCPRWPVRHETTGGPGRLRNGDLTTARRYTTHTRRVTTRTRAPAKVCVEIMPWTKDKWRKG